MWSPALILSLACWAAPQGEPAETPSEAVPQVDAAEADAALPRLRLGPAPAEGRARLTLLFPGGRAESPAVSPSAVDALATLLADGLELPGVELELGVLPGALWLRCGLDEARTIQTLEELGPQLGLPFEDPTAIERALDAARALRDPDALAGFARLELGLRRVAFETRLPQARPPSAAERDALDAAELRALADRLLDAQDVRMLLETSMDAAVALPVLEGFAESLPRGTGDAEPDAESQVRSGPVILPRPAPAGLGPVFRDPELRGAADPQLAHVLLEGPAPAADDPAAHDLALWLEWYTGPEGTLGRRLAELEAGAARYRIGPTELGRDALQLQLELPAEELSRLAEWLYLSAEPAAALPTGEALATAVLRSADPDARAARLDLPNTGGGAAALGQLLRSRTFSGPIEPERARAAALVWFDTEALWIGVSGIGELDPQLSPQPLFTKAWERTEPDARAAVGALLEALGGEAAWRALRQTATAAQVVITLPEGELELQLDTERRFAPFGLRIEQLQAGRRIVQRVVPGASDRSIDERLEQRPAQEAWQLLAAEERGLERLLWGLAQRGPVGARLVEVGARGPGPEPGPEDVPGAPPKEAAADVVEAPTASGPTLELFDARGDLARIEIGADGLPARLTAIQPGPSRSYTYTEFTEQPPRLPQQIVLEGDLRRVTTATEIRVDPELADERFDPR